MSETKALDELSAKDWNKLNFLEACIVKAQDNEAAAELAELKEELETRTTQFQEALSESVKDKQTIARLRADLEEAIELISGEVHLPTPESGLQYCTITGPIDIEKASTFLERMEGGDA